MISLCTKLIKPLDSTIREFSLSPISHPPVTLTPSETERPGHSSTASFVLLFFSAINTTSAFLYLHSGHPLWCLADHATSNAAAVAYFHPLLSSTKTYFLVEQKI